jgi:hypothetical protein
MSTGIKLHISYSVQMTDQFEMKIYLSLYDFL